MSPVTIALYAIWEISGLATVILVVMNSGKGTDLSDIVVFIICMLLCMLFFPQGSLSLGAFTN